MSLFNRMKIYTVHIKPDAPQAMEKPIFVREGFNFFAFALTILWALYHRVWRLALLIVAFNIVSLLLGKAHILNPLSLAIIQLGFQVIIGFHANDWLRAQLSRRGYIMADISTGDNLLRAEQRYLERYLATA